MSTAYKIINNTVASDNHYTRLRMLFEQSDDVLLVSPFLMGDFSDFFSEINLSCLKKLHLVTTLLPRSFDQIRKIGALVSLIDLPPIKSKKVASRISLDNKLHGKIYIFKKHDHYISAIITSANFTDSGLSLKHEWGIEITDQQQIAQLKNNIIDQIEIADLLTDDVYRMQDAANKFLGDHPQTEAREVDLNLINIIPKIRWASVLDNTVQYWLKPIGVTAEPVTEDRLFTDINYDLHFSKQRPNGVKPNDILIAYGVGTTKLLSVYQAMTFPDKKTNPQDEWQKRWPWFVTGHNLTAKFGGQWFKYNLFTNSLKNEYLTKHPDGTITAVGGKTLGGLNFGKDKLKLSPGFAKFIIDKIVDLNDQIGQ